MPLGQIVILNGVPRSGKSSIAAAIQESFDGVWMNLGVDTSIQSTPQRFRPGIGLRPHAGEQVRHIEAMVPQLYAGLFESIASHSRLGMNVVIDVGIHDAYSKPLDILGDCAKRLAGLPVLFVGVRCPIAVIVERRNAGQPGREGMYVKGTADVPIPPAVPLWEQAVHTPGIYDIEVDTSVLNPAECAAVIRTRLESGALSLLSCI